MRWYEYTIHDPYLESPVVIWIMAYDQIDADKQITDMTTPSAYLTIEMTSQRDEAPPSWRKTVTDQVKARQRPDIEFPDEIPF